MKRTLKRPHPFEATRLRRLALPAAVSLVLSAIIAAGCGVSFDSNPEESEILKELSVTGDFVPGGALTLTLDYEQPYPALISVACDVLEDRNAPRAERQVAHIPEKPLAVNDNGGPVGEATPIAERLEQQFTAPERPGRYQLDCYTVGEEDNDIERIITISPEMADETTGP